MNRISITALLAFLLLSTLPVVPVAAAQSSEVCGGVVFHDYDANGEWEPNHQHNPENPVARANVTVTDAADATSTISTTDDGLWRAPADLVFPVRVDFAAPGELSIAPAGPFSGMSTQFFVSAAECSESDQGNVGVHNPDEFCTRNPTLVTACFVVGDSIDHDDMAAIVGVTYDVTDNETTDASSAADWMNPLYGTIATVGEIGAVHDVAIGPDGSVFAGAFTKRHTRLASSLNPAGNPSVIYRIPRGGTAEVFATLDELADDPHDDDGSETDQEPDYRTDHAAASAVFTTGLGGLQVSEDGTQLFVVELGKRQLVTIDIATAAVLKRTDLTGATLGIDDCGASASNPFGDLRPFGLGLDSDGSVLIGVVCSAASSVSQNDFPVDRSSQERSAGDPTQLRGYVIDVAGGSFEPRLDWPLAADRGRMQDNGRLSHDAIWHPWVDVYPFTEEYGQTAYPQPAITDIVVDDGGDLIIALADRWGHQTGPRTDMIAWDGATRTVAEPLNAGDLVRACPKEDNDNDGWVIEGSSACPNQGRSEHFVDDRYGIHDETAFGSVVKVPGYSGVVATHMNPVQAADTWQAGGLIWHDVESGTAEKGVRLYDGRSANPEGTFEKAAGLGGLAVDCGGAPVQIGSTIWYDLDADGRRDPSEQPIPGVHVMLMSDAGQELAREITDDDGGYLFDNRTNAPALAHGDQYRVVIGADNFRDGAVFGDNGSYAGLKLTPLPPGGIVSGASDHRAVYLDIGSDGPLPAVTGVATGVDHSTGFAMADHYELEVITTIEDLDLGQGAVRLNVTVRNVGSVPSGTFTVRNVLPAGTTAVTTTPPADTLVEDTAEVVRWEFTAAQGLEPGDVRNLQVVASFDELTVNMRNETTVISGTLDADAVDATHTLVLGIGEIGGALWFDDEAAPANIHVQLRDSRDDVVSTTTTGDDGRYSFSELQFGTYSVSVLRDANDPASPLRDRVLVTDRDQSAVLVVLNAASPLNESDGSPSNTLDRVSDLTVDFSFATASDNTKLVVVSLLVVAMALLGLAAFGTRRSRATI